MLLLAFLAVGQESNPVTFRLTIRGEIEDTAATKAGFHTANFRTTHLGFSEYEASNGEKVVINNGHFGNTEEARRYFDWMLEKWTAQNVVQGEKLDRDGKTVGRRAEYSVESKGKNKRFWVVMWTEKEGFHLIHAPTLESVIGLEKLCRN